MTDNIKLIKDIDRLCALFGPKNLDLSSCSNAWEDILAMQLLQKEIEKQKNKLAGICVPLSLHFPPNRLTVLLFLTRKSWNYKLLVGRYRGDSNGWSPSHVNRVAEQITHWMVIPNPPT